jgi:hypothetical protein
MKRSLACHISQLAVARRNCIASGNKEWQDKHEDALHRIQKMLLPSGSGIDNGTKIDLDKTNGSKVVLTFGFHFMNENGFYDGWGDFEAVIRPAFNGLDILIKGRDRDQIKDYLYEVFGHCLGMEYEIQDLP